jgi:hypothetical protein
MPHVGGKRLHISSTEFMEDVGSSFQQAGTNFSEAFENMKGENVYSYFSCPPLVVVPGSSAPLPSHWSVTIGACSCGDDAEAPGEGEGRGYGRGGELSRCRRAVSSSVWQNCYLREAPQQTSLPPLQDSCYCYF